MLKRIKLLVCASKQDYTNDENHNEVIEVESMQEWFSALQCQNLPHPMLNRQLSPEIPLVQGTLCWSTYFGEGTSLLFWLLSVHLNVGFGKPTIKNKKNLKKTTYCQ
jgi:hypothetical protein